MTIDASSGVSNNFGVAFGAYEDQQDVFRINFDLTSSNAYGCPALFMTHDNKEYNFTPLVVPEDKIFNIKIVAEESVCVMYVNGTTAFSNRIYAMNQNPWMIFAEQGTVKFSNIRIYKQ
jgi:beta-fructofuranosidase